MTNGVTVYDYDSVEIAGIPYAIDDLAAMLATNLDSAQIVALIEALAPNLDAIQLDFLADRFIDQMQRGKMAVRRSG